MVSVQWLPESSQFLREGPSVIRLGGWPLSCRGDHWSPVLQWGRTGRRGRVCGRARPSHPLRGSSPQGRAFWLGGCLLFCRGDHWSPARCGVGALQGIRQAAAWAKAPLCKGSCPAGAEGLSSPVMRRGMLDALYFLSREKVPKTVRGRRTPVFDSPAPDPRAYEHDDVPEPRGGALGRGVSVPRTIRGALVRKGRRALAGSLLVRLCSRLCVAPRPLRGGTPAKEPTPRGSAKTGRCVRQSLRLA